MAELTAGRRKLILAICCMSLLIVGMDNTIVNVALPAIHTDLHASLSDLQWTIDAYTLVLASLLMLSGSTADRVGRKRTFQVGLLIFTLGSLLCSLAPGLGWLVAFRMMQAVGGSMLNPVAMSIITNVFVNPRERAAAIGVWGGVVGISIGLGPVVGGLLIESVGWRGIFWINVPIGLAAIVLTALFVPESRAEHARRADPLGQLAVIVLLASLVYAIIEAPRRGWTSSTTILALVLAVLAAVALVVHERRRTEPLLELRFFRSVPFTAATIIAVCALGAYSGLLFINTLYLQQVRGMSALRAGLCLLPMAAVVIVVAPLSGRILGRYGPRIPLLLAGAGICVGGLMLTGLRADSPLSLLLAALVVFAIGFGVVNAPITNSAVSGMPRSQAGVAAAIASTSRQVGATLGVAVVGAIVNSRLGDHPIRTGLCSAATPAWWLIAAAGAAVFLVGLIGSSGWARRTSAAVAAQATHPKVLLVKGV